MQRRPDRGHHHHHAHTHVEGAERLGACDAARFDQPVEDGRGIGLEHLSVDAGPQPGGQYAGEVLGETTTGDVGEGANGDARGAEGIDLGEIGAVGAQQGVGQGAVEGRPVCGEVEAGDDPARQGVAVGVQSGGAQAEQCVAGRHGLAVDDGVPVDHTHDGANYVELAIHVHAGHLRGLTTPGAHSQMPCRPRRHPRTNAET